MTVYNSPSLFYSLCKQLTLAFTQWSLMMSRHNCKYARFRTVLIPKSFCQVSCLTFREAPSCTVLMMPTTWQFWRSLNVFFFITARPRRSCKEVPRPQSFLLDRHGDGYSRSWADLHLSQYANESEWQRERSSSWSQACWRMRQADCKHL